MAKPGSELVGRRFLHKHWLDPVAMPDKVPAEFQVTAVRNGQVYIRPIYDKGGSNERLGSGMYRPLSSFEEKDVLRWTNPGHKHLTGSVSAKAQHAYEHIKASLSGSRKKEIAARTVRKMIGEGILNPNDRFSDLNKQGFMKRAYKSMQTPKPKKEKKIVRCERCQDWHWEGQHTKKKSNPSSITEEISEGFHGRKISEVLEVEEEELIPDNTAVLGCLLDITVTRDNGKTGIPIIFLRDGQRPKRGEEVYVCAPDRHNLEFVGGDQEIRGIEKLCGCDHSKQFVKLGFVESLAYLADKHHLEGSNGREEPYEHEFGKKKWMGFGKKYGRPELIYDTRNCKISLVGGTYTIEDEGITN